MAQEVAGWTQVNNPHNHEQAFLHTIQNLEQENSELKSQLQNIKATKSKNTQKRKAKPSSPTASDQEEDQHEPEELDEEVEIEVIEEQPPVKRAKVAVVLPAPAAPKAANRPKAAAKHNPLLSHGFARKSTASIAAKTKSIPGHDDTLKPFTPDQMEQQLFGNKMFGQVEKKDHSKLHINFVKVMKVPKNKESAITEFRDKMLKLF